MSRKCFFKFNCIFLIYKESECFWDNFVIQGFHYPLTHSSFCDELSDSTTTSESPISSLFWKKSGLFQYKKGCQAHYSETSLDYFNIKKAALHKSSVDLRISANVIFLHSFSCSLSLFFVLWYLLKGLQLNQLVLLDESLLRHMRLAPPLDIFPSI